MNETKLVLVKQRFHSDFAYLKNTVFITGTGQANYSLQLTPDQQNQAIKQKL